MYKKLRKLCEEYEKESANKELEKEILRCWADPEFQKIRELFHKFIIGEGGGSDYIQSLAYLFGIDEESDGWSCCWGGLNDNDKAKYIRL